jgi:hypothetical protein
MLGAVNNPTLAGTKSGKPALINVVGDKRIGHPTLGGNLLGSTQV